MRNAVQVAVCLLALLASGAAQQKMRMQAPGARLLKYHATINDVKYTYGVALPVARLRSGDTLEVNTLDAFGNVLKGPGDTLSMVKGDNPLTGPFYIEGAEPGDTLAIKFLDLQVDGDQGVGAFAPGFGALNSSTYTPMLGAPLPERIWYYPVDHAANTATFHAHDSNFSVQIPLHPFFGCIGVAPAGGEARSSMGDGHAAMGDGEVDGTAIEAPLRARLQVTVIKGHKIEWPRFENENSIMAVGITRPLDDALRVAFTQLVGWIHQDYGLSELDAYELLSKVAKIHLDEMVDPNYVIVASVDKKYLPPRRH